MPRAGGPNANLCYPLQEDPELAEAIEPSRRDAAVDALVARAIDIPARAWQARRTPLNGGIGLLRPLENRWLLSGKPPGASA